MKVQVFSIHPIYDNRIQKHLDTLLRHGCQVQYVNASIAGPAAGKSEKKGIDLKRIHVDFRKENVLGAMYCLLRMSFLALFGKANIIHIHDALLLPLAFVGWLARKSVVYDRHESYEMIDCMNARIGHLMEKIFMRFVDGVVLVNEAQVRYMKRAQVKMVRLIPNYQSAGKFSLAVPEARSRSRFIYFGALDNDSRDMDFMFEFIEKILAKRTDAECIIGGRIASRGVAERISLLEKSQRFRYLGVVPYGRVVKETVSGDIGMYFVRDIPNNKFSSPNKIFEYMIAGVPVLAIGTFSHMDEIDGNAGVVFSFGSSVGDVVESAVRIMDDKERMESMKARAREIGEKYTWESVEGRYIELYRDVLCRKAPLRARGDQDGGSRR